MTRPRKPRQQVPASDQGLRRDRHGRGLRRPLVPPELPLRRTRAEAFDDLVLDAVEHLDDRWGKQLADVEFAVEDVPPVPDISLVDHAVVPLARVFPAAPRTPARIVVYRRPVEARATDPDDLADLIHDVVVEHVAELLGLEPGTIDPGYGEDDWEE